MVTTTRHKVFVSYHHDLDEKYKNIFCEMRGFDIVDKSVEDGDIDINMNTEAVRQKIRDEFIAEASVTVVLVGRCTWQRKHVDWEIGSSLRKTKLNPRCGLLGILLPTHDDFRKSQCRRRLLPPRLSDNCGGENTYAAIYHWPSSWNATAVRSWIHKAFQRRNSMPPPVNSRAQFLHNRTSNHSMGWTGSIENETYGTGEQVIARHY